MSNFFVLELLQTQGKESFVSNFRWLGGGADFGAVIGELVSNFFVGSQDLFCFGTEQVLYLLRKGLMRLLEAQEEK